MFSQVDVYLNQKLISSPNNTYGYKCYLETLLNYGPKAKQSHLTCGLWYKDTKGQMEALTAANEGYAARRRLTAGSKEIDLIGHLHGDVFNQEKYLLNGVELGVKLVRAKNSFALMAENVTGKV